jgi:glycosyltransferase involved in cell wall biosynthesis
MLTILIATRNGEAVLGRTLAAFAAATPPETPWQMVVVDNGSTDATPAILAAHAGRLPIRVVRHAPPGKNAALNAAVAACDGDLIVIVDDDVLPDAHFLRAWSSYLTERTEHELLGGPAGCCGSRGTWS